MYNSSFVRGELAAAIIILLAAGCSYAGQFGLGVAKTTDQPATRGMNAARGPGLRIMSVLPPKYQATLRPHRTKSWMSKADALAHLVYVSDYFANDVTVFDRKSGRMRGQIGGLANPQGIFIDSRRNLWVANSGTAQILVFNAVRPCQVQPLAIPPVNPLM